MSTISASTNNKIYRLNGYRVRVKHTVRREYQILKTRDFRTDGLLNSNTLSSVHYNRLFRGNKNDGNKRVDGIRRTREKRQKN